MIQQHHIDAAKTTADTVSIGAAMLWIGGAIGWVTANLVPPLAAVASLVYMLIRIYETPTVQKLVKGKDVSQTTDDRS